MTNTEDVNTKMRACGWHVIDVEDGCYDIAGIVEALEAAKLSEKPTFVNVRTIIGLGSKREGTAEAHGAAFGVEDVANMKRAFGFNPEESFVVVDAVRKFFQGLPSRGEEHVRAWNGLLGRYSQEYPELAAKLHSRIKGELSGWEQLVPKTFSDQPTATRVSSGMVFNPIAKEIDSFMVGTADLSPSVNLIWPGKLDFQHVSSPLPPTTHVE